MWFCVAVGDFGLRGLEKVITQTFQKNVISDAERQQIVSVKVRIDLCQGRYQPRVGH